ncbi:Protein COFACTOR ASSEMBLY OF COMPLEX C SUBUNIT B CCB4, chloroplastic [Linum perenne]
MEAGTLLHRATACSFSSRRHLHLPPREVRASSSNSQKIYKGLKPKRDFVPDLVSSNDDSVRRLPIYVGGGALASVLVNRAVSGIAPVADASRVWESLSSATCCKSLVVVYDCSCILQIGVAAESPDGKAQAVDAATLAEGSVYQGVMKSGSQSYLANLSLYPGRSQLPFLPSNTQAVILQPLGDKGIVIIGGDKIRGFTNSDQAWISYLGEKLDATMAKHAIQTPLAIQDPV